MAYTADEMREMAQKYENMSAERTSYAVRLEIAGFDQQASSASYYANMHKEAAAMLRQAADAMDTFDGVRDAMADEIQALRDEAEITPAKD